MDNTSNLRFEFPNGANIEVYVDNKGGGWIYIRKARKVTEPKVIHKLKAPCWDPSKKCKCGTKVMSIGIEV